MIFSQVGQIELLISVIINRLVSLLNFRMLSIFLTRPTARKTRYGEPAQNIWLH